MDLLGLEEAPKYCPICGAELSEADLRQGKCPTCGQKPPDTAAAERVAEKRELRIAGKLSLAAAIVALLLVIVAACWALAETNTVVHNLLGVIDDIQIKGERFTEKEIMERCSYAGSVVPGILLTVVTVLCLAVSVLAGIVGLARSDRKALAAVGLMLGTIAVVLTFVVFFLSATGGWAVDAD